MGSGLACQLNSRQEGGLLFHCRGEREKAKVGVSCQNDRQPLATRFLKAPPCPVRIREKAPASVRVATMIPRINAVIISRAHGDQFAASSTSDAGPCNREKGNDVLYQHRARRLGPKRRRLHILPDISSGVLWHPAGHRCGRPDLTPGAMKETRRASSPRGMCRGHGMLGAMVVAKSEERL
jgi:hypothetical protein